MKGKMNGPTKKKKLRKKNNNKNKTAIDCRLVLTEDFFFYYNVTYNITAFFWQLQRKKGKKMVYQNVLT